MSDIPVRKSLRCKIRMYKNPNNYCGRDVKFVIYNTFEHVALPVCEECEEQIVDDGKNNWRVIARLEDGIWIFSQVDAYKRKAEETIDLWESMPEELQAASGCSSKACVYIILVPVFVSLLLQSWRLIQASKEAFTLGNPLVICFIASVLGLLWILSKVFSRSKSRS